jgi:hypothetical protein
MMAVELKKPEPVNDRCAKCQQPLFCERCNTHPTHKPYPKQAISQLVREIAPTAKWLFESLDKARNTLLHGGRLNSIESELPCTTEYLIDTLAKLTREILWRDMKKRLASGHPPRLHMTAPSTYLHYDLHAAVAIKSDLGAKRGEKPDIRKAPEISVTFTAVPEK